MGEKSIDPNEVKVPRELEPKLRVLKDEVETELEEGAKYVGRRIHNRYKFPLNWIAQGVFSFIAEDAVVKRGKKYNKTIQTAAVYYVMNGHDLGKTVDLFEDACNKFDEVYVRADKKNPDFKGLAKILRRTKEHQVNFVAQILEYGKFEEGDEDPYASMLRTTFTEKEAYEQLKGQLELYEKAKQYLHIMKIPNFIKSDIIWAIGVTQEYVETRIDKRIEGAKLKETITRKKAFDAQKIYKEACATSAS